MKDFPDGKAAKPRPASRPTAQPNGPPARDQTRAARSVSTAGDARAAVRAQGDGDAPAALRPQADSDACGFPVLLLVYTFLALYLIPIFPHGGSANEETRWATAASLVEHGSFEISWTERLLGPIADTARIGDRLYSNKAPGTVLLALPGYLLPRPFVGPPDARNIRVSWTLMRWLVSTLPLLAFALTLQRRGSDPIALTVALFATPLFLYSLLLFSHVLAATAIYGAYRLLFRSPEGPPARDAAAAGLLAGTAVSAEFTSSIAVLVFAAALLLARGLPRTTPVGRHAATGPGRGGPPPGVLSTRSRIRTLLWFVLGGVPFALGLAVYNTAVFGSPLSFSYAHESFKEWAEVAGKGIFGIGLPDPRNLWLLLLSPSRGLFFFSPVLLVAVPELFRLRGEGASRQRVRAAAVIAGVVLISGHGAAHGGWAAGPRYIIPFLPLLVESLVDVPPGRLRGAGTGVLLGISLVSCVLPALAFPFSPPEFGFPHNTFWRPLLLSERWATPTLGSLVGLGSGLPALVPVAAALLVALAIVLRSAPRRLLGGVAAGVALAAVFMTVPGLDGEELATRRASIAERFFAPRGRLAAFRSRATDPARRWFLESMQWEIADLAADAPSNWPYSDQPLARDGPTSLIRRAATLQGQGKLADAERVLLSARDEFGFARCEMTDALSVVLYLSGRKDEALDQLENIRPLVAGSERYGCRSTLMHLGSLYQERGRAVDALGAFQEFLRETEGAPDPQVAPAREKARKLVEALTRSVAGR